MSESAQFVFLHNIYYFFCLRQVLVILWS
uniref:Uncharacterized protein n=1 Tax=Anguilla anguilla TaxID=7936 RepID=A0A0E9Q7Y6_ANGAN